MAETVAIVNPKASGGKTVRQWPAFEKALRERGVPVRTLETERADHASELARRALESDADTVIAVGGDGTANEVLNGMIVDGKPVRAFQRFLYVPMGTGGDLQRTLRLPETPEEVAAMAAYGETAAIDVGRLRLTSREGVERERLFLNLTSFGMGGDVSIVSKQTPLAKLSGQAAFIYGTFRVFLSYRGKTVRLYLDDRPEPIECEITNVAIGNGRYHGGGMHPCPLADLTDGLFEVTTIERLGMFELIRDLRILYSDNVYVHEKVTHYRARRLRAVADEEVLAEVDGESLGGLPMEAEVLPGVLTLGVPRGHWLA